MGLGCASGPVSKLRGVPPERSPDVRLVGRPLENLITKHHVVDGHRLTVVEGDAGSDVDIDHRLGGRRRHDERITRPARSLRGIRQDGEDDIIRSTGKQSFEAPFDLICIPHRVCVRIEVVEGRHVVLQSDDEFRSLALCGDRLCREDKRGTKQDKDDRNCAQTRRAQ